MCSFLCIWLFPIITMKIFIHNIKNIHKAKYCHLAAYLDSTSPLQQRKNFKRTNLFRLASFWTYICFVEISFEFCTSHIYAVQCAKQTMGLSDLSLVWKRWEITVVVSHRFDYFGKVELSMIIKLKFIFINYRNVNIRIAHTNHKTWKHMTILMIQLNEPWKRVSAEVLGQDGLGGKRHLVK